MYQPHHGDSYGYDDGRQYDEGGAVYQGESDYGAAYYDPQTGAYHDPSSGYDQYHQSHLQSQHEQYFNQGQQSSVVAEYADQIPYGDYYEAMRFAPSLRQAPVSCVAFDRSPLGLSSDQIALPHELLFVSSVQSSVRTASSAPSVGGGPPPSAGGQFIKASMLSVHQIPTCQLYAAVAAHPAVDASLCDVLARSLAGDKVYDPKVAMPVIDKATGAVAPSARSAALSPQASTPAAAGAPPSAFDWQADRLPSKVGVSALLPFNGGVISLSGHGLRFHARGGLLLADIPHVAFGSSSTSPSVFPAPPTAACFNPPFYESGGLYPTHLTVSSPTTGVLTVLDLYAGFVPSQYCDVVGVPSATNASTGVTCLASSAQGSGRIVAGCSDGTVRILDGQLRSSRRRYDQKVSVLGGSLRDVSISDCGNYVAVVGYAGGAERRAYADHHVHVLDLRMVGRRPVQRQFTGAGGTPSFVKFLPSDTGGAGDLPAASLLLLAGSAKPNGGLQIMAPLGDPSYAKFLTPAMEGGEIITSVDISPSGSLFAIGTSHSSVVLFERNGFDRTVHLPTASTSLDAPSHPRKLCTPPYVAAPPLSSIDASTLSLRGPVLVNPFNLYALRSHPVSTGPEAFRGLADELALPPPKRVLAKPLKDNKSDVGKHDFVAHVRCDSVGLKEIDKERGGGKVLNYNQLLYDKQKSDLCYAADADPRLATNKSLGRQEDASILSHYRKTLKPTGAKLVMNFSYAKHNDTGLWPGLDSGNNMPNVYASPVLTLLYFVPELRASLLREQFEHRIFESAQDSTNFLTPTPGALSAELGFLFHQMDSLTNYAWCHEGLDPSVGAASPANFLATFAMLPEAASRALLDGIPSAVKLPRRVEAFYFFLVHHLNQEMVTVGDEYWDGTSPTSGGSSSTTAMGSAAVVAAAAAKKTSNYKGKNYKESLNPNFSGVSDKFVDNTSKVVDNLQGFDFASVNEFVTGSAPPMSSSTRALTVELTYDKFIGRKAADVGDRKVYFSDVLRETLCRETRLRAWCEATKAYETTVQRRTITSLPTLLSVQCSCAGGDESVALWRGTNEDGGRWLPKQLEIELHPDGALSISELVDGGGQSNSPYWRRDDKSPVAASAAVEAHAGSEDKEVAEDEKKRGATPSKKVGNNNARTGAKKDGDDNSLTAVDQSKRKIHYELIAVVSHIKCGDDESAGHHVTHLKVPKAYALRALARQAEFCDMCAEQVDENTQSSESTSDDVATPAAKPQKQQSLNLSSNASNVAERLSFVELEPPQSAAGSPSPASPSATLKPAVVPRAKDLTSASKISAATYRIRSKKVRDDLAAELSAMSSSSEMNGKEEDKCWVVFNGFVVTTKGVDEARDFTPSWKEPCIIIYREIDAGGSLPSLVGSPSGVKTPNPKQQSAKDEKHQMRGGVAAESKKGGETSSALFSPEMIRALGGDTERNLSIPPSVMHATPLTNKATSPYMSFGPNYVDLPGKGDILAIDTEFVSVQHEESVLTNSGGKVVIVENRSALARMSVVDCRSGTVIIDDYVLPQEPIVDYLTRFSGICAADLDPLTTNRHLVTMRTAYLKLRLLVDRGCFFVGHGLDTDFRILNVFVPPNQVIDTVSIYHQPKSRMIGLRFLVNYMLKHDMQQDTHDSIEDARAAYDLYLKALELKSSADPGAFSRKLNEIYEFGRKTDWQLGLGEESEARSRARSGSGGGSGRKTIGGGRGGGGRGGR